MKVNAAFGNGVAGKSYVVTRQRRVNCYYESRPDGDKSKAVIYGTPGLLFAANLNTPSSVPLRGMLGTPFGILTVASNSFAQYSSSYLNVYNTTISSIQGNVQFATSASQSMMTDGSAGYVFTPGSLSKITSAGFPNGAQTCTFVSNYFVAEVPGTQKFQVSNSGDATTWQVLAFGAASQGSDSILAVDSLTSNLICFSQQHLEFQQATGATPEPFVPILSATVEWGLAAIWSRAHVANSICFLAQSPQGGFAVCKINGYRVDRISSPDVDSIIATFPVFNDAVGLSYRTDTGHPMYQLTFPTANRSFLYDLSTGIESETQSGTVQGPGAGSYNRHIGQFSTLNGSQSIVSDYSRGLVYTLSAATYTDTSTQFPILREVITRHHLENFNVFSIDELYLDMETGVGLVSGLGSSPVVGLEISKDNGRTWQQQRLASLGAMGQYTTRVIWRRLGSARVFDFRIRMTDPVKFVLTDMAQTRRERKQ